MKKLLKVVIITILILAVILGIIMFFMGINPFINWEKRIGNDYNEQGEAFQSIVSSADGEFAVFDDDNYDSNNSDYKVIFEELNYQFIREYENEIYFCKTIDGMTEVGILYTKDSEWKPTIKQGIMGVLDDEGHWYIYFEHLL